MGRDDGADHRLRGRGRALLAALRRPDVQTDVMQVVKTTVATVLAWWVATHVFELKQGFLAAWVALLTVHATVYRTFWRGTQSVLAAGIGIVVSFVAVQLLGLGLLSLGAAVLAGLVIARTPLIRQEGVTVATTAVFVITAGSVDQEMLLLHRFLDTGIGVLVGLLVNVVVRPPLDDRLAEGAIDEALDGLAALLARISDDFDEDVTVETVDAWLDETLEIDIVLDHAADQLSFARESQWANPRRRLDARSTLDADRGRHVLLRLEDGVAHARALTRFVAEAIEAEQEWDPEFRRRWSCVLGDIGTWVSEPEAGSADLLAELEDLTERLSDDGLPQLHWPVYGALLASTANVIRILDDVKQSRAALA